MKSDIFVSPYWCPHRFRWEVGIQGLYPLSTLNRSNRLRMSVWRQMIIHLLAFLWKYAYLVESICHIVVLEIYITVRRILNQFKLIVNITMWWGIDLVFFRWTLSGLVFDYFGDGMILQNARNPVWIIEKAANRDYFSTLK